MHKMQNEGEKPIIEIDKNWLKRQKGSSSNVASERSEKMRVPRRMWVHPSFRERKSRLSQGYYHIWLLGRCCVYEKSGFHR